MSSSFFFIVVICADLLDTLIGNADRQIKRFFWKKNIKADEKTKREFRLHHIVQCLTALAVLTAFYLTKNTTILLVGCPIILIHTAIITFYFRKRI